MFDYDAAADQLIDYVTPTSWKDRTMRDHSHRWGMITTGSWAGWSKCRVCRRKESTGKLLRERGIQSDPA